MWVRVAVAFPGVELEVVAIKVEVTAPVTATPVAVEGLLLCSTTGRQ
jgi:hypothetical protein